MPRNKVYKCPSSWELGTTASGNLPQFKRLQNLCEVDMSLITYPYIKVSDFHVYHIKCPYSLQAEQHYVRDVDISSPTYWKQIELAPGDLTDHVDTKGIMIVEHRGPKHGFMCVDNACKYYLDTGNRYFYI